MVVKRLQVFAALAVVLFSGVMLQSVLAEPPTDQEYTGSKRCASCHFDQFMKWKKTNHAKAFKDLTAKYQTDEKCLKCHTTGHGNPTGFDTASAELKTALQNVGCESCHGPGSKHEEAAKPFAQVKNLTKEQEEMIRGTIWKMLPQNVCVECHKLQAHGESETPPDMKKE